MGNGTRYGVKTERGGIICHRPGRKGVIAINFYHVAGPGAWIPKVWKTLGGAQRVADRYNANAFTTTWLSEVAEQK